MNWNGVADVLLPRALGMLSAEARGALASVVELAAAADLVGPPPVPADLVELCVQLASGSVPWQLVAAAVYVYPGRAGAVRDLVELCGRRGIAGGVVAWTLDRASAERVLLSYQALLARELEPGGLDALGRAISNG